MLEPSLEFVVVRIANLMFDMYVANVYLSINPSGCFMASLALSRMLEQTPKD